MKRFEFIIILIILFLTSIVYAGSGNQTTFYDVNASYNAQGVNNATGNAQSKVFAPKGNVYTLSGNNYDGAAAWSSQKVTSSAWGKSQTGVVETSVNGFAGQYSAANADDGMGNIATGYTRTSAYYSAHLKTTGYAYSKGMAKVKGGIAAGSMHFEHNNTTVGMAGAIAGSKAKASTNQLSGPTVTNVFGYGGVIHSSYASRGNGSATTYGDANYDYSKQIIGPNARVKGSGFAATGGISTVTTKPNGSIVATAKSMSISTSGRVTAAGETHISNINIK